jgi:hypothetical protein
MELRTQLHNLAALPPGNKSSPLCVALLTLVQGLHPSGAEVKNEWSYTSDPPVCLHGLQKENFTFTCSTEVGARGGAVG